MNIEPTEAIKKVREAVDPSTWKYGYDGQQVFVGRAIIDSLDEVVEDRFMIYRERIPFEVEYMGSLDDEEVAVVRDTDEEQYSRAVPEDLFYERFVPLIESEIEDGQEVFSLDVQFDAAGVEREWMDAADTARPHSYRSRPQEVREDDVTPVGVTYSYRSDIYPHPSERGERFVLAAREFYEGINNDTDSTVEIPIIGEQAVEKQSEGGPAVSATMESEPLAFEYELVDAVVAKDHYVVRDVRIPSLDATREA